MRRAFHCQPPGGWFSFMVVRTTHVVCFAKIGDLRAQTRLSNLQSQFFLLCRSKHQGQQRHTHNNTVEGFLPVT